MTLSLETYARLLAHLATRRGARLPDVLAELGISPDDLRDSEPALRAQLSASWPRRKGIAAMKFASALGDELAKLHLLAVDAPPDAPPPPRPAEPEKALPTFLQPAPLPASPIIPIAPAPPPQSVAATTEADLRTIIASAERGALPFADRPADTPSPVAAPAPPKVNRPPAHLAGTAEADFSAILAGIRGGALPFGGAPRPPPPAPPPPEPAPPQPPPPPAGATQALPVFDIDFERYPLELYARVTGAVARGEPRDDVLAAHNLTPDLFDQIARAWSARFRSEPALLDRFKELVRPRGD